MTRRIDRRRFIKIAASAAALTLAGAGGAHAKPRLHRWRGLALGADAEIILHHADETTARRLIDQCVAEIGRLEAVFSLYRSDSALSRLNAAGVLEAPPLDLVRLLADCAQLSRSSSGAFDVTVQPLWSLYAAHFAGGATTAPDATQLAETLARVDFRAVRLSSARVEFAKPGMAMTLNGIAQGYITDRVAERLIAAGLDNVLIDLGETRALGHHPDGRPWQVGLADPDSGIWQTLEIANRAVASSGGYGTRFDQSGRHHHLLDPRTGGSAAHHKAVTVLAHDATTADGLSTALSIMPLADARALLAKFPGTEAWLLGAEREVSHLS